MSLEPRGSEFDFGPQFDSHHVLIAAGLLHRPAGIQIPQFAGASDYAFGQQEAGREVQVVAWRAHRDREWQVFSRPDWAVPQYDLQRLLDRQEVALFREPVGIDAQQACRRRFFFTLALEGRFHPSVIAVSRPQRVIMGWP